MATVECKIFRLTAENRALFETFTRTSFAPDTAFVATQEDGYAELTQEEFLDLTKEFGFVLPNTLIVSYYDMQFVAD